jgi:N-acetylglucosaminyldiphosphoundecaprenol N-acetyl-beta-D-mannosaminyltransferase
MKDLRDRQMSLCGVRVDALERGDLIQILDQARPDSGVLILNHNLHSLYLYQTDPAFRASYRDATWVYVDGMPVVWLGQAAGLPISAAHRITFLDCFEDILKESAERGWRVFYLGSTEATLTKGLAMLRERHPQLVIGGRNGFFAKSGPESEEVIAEINRFGAHVLFVGMGMPTQEAWIVEHRSKLRVSAILTSGATLDYITGEAYRPPAWAGPLGLYGVFRLFSDPKRLWRRYLVEPLYLAGFLSFPLIRQRLGVKGRRQGS